MPTSTPHALPSMRDVAQYSGLELMQATLAGERPGPPMGDLLNYRLHAVAEGRIVFRGTPLGAMTNPMGTVHGGWYGTLLDSAMACAVLTKIPKGVAYTTLEYKINILRSVPLGVTVDCIGEIDHVGRTTGVSHGEIRGVEDGKLYATGSTTCIVLDLR